eukprot:jgi/Chrzof1/6932/Cz02g04030.t1
MCNFATYCRGESSVVVRQHPVRPSAVYKSAVEYAATSCNPDTAATPTRDNRLVCLSIKTAPWYQFNTLVNAKLSVRPTGAGQTKQEITPTTPEQAPIEETTCMPAATTSTCSTSEATAAAMWSAARAMSWSLSAHMAAARSSFRGLKASVSSKMMRGSSRKTMVADAAEGLPTCELTTASNEDNVKLSTAASVEHNGLVDNAKSAAAASPATTTAAARLQWQRCKSSIVSMLSRRHQKAGVLVC